MQQAATNQSNFVYNNNNNNNNNNINNNNGFRFPPPSVGTSHLGTNSMILTMSPRFTVPTNQASLYGNSTSNSGLGISNNQLQQY